MRQVRRTNSSGAPPVKPTAIPRSDAPVICSAGRMESPEGCTAGTPRALCWSPGCPGNTPAGAGGAVVVAAAGVADEPAAAGVEANQRRATEAAAAAGRAARADAAGRTARVKESRREVMSARVHRRVSCCCS